MDPGDLEALALRAAAGDRDAFEFVCRALQDDIWRYCHAVTGDRDLAFEATQETFLRSVTAIRRYRGDAPVRLWLLVLARRAAWQTRRLHRRRLDLPGFASIPDTADQGSLGHVEVEALIAGLPEAQREAFVLTQLLGLPYEDAAQVAGCAIGTIRSRVHRARDRLITELSTDHAEEPDATT